MGACDSGIRNDASTTVVGVDWLPNMWSLADLKASAALLNALTVTEVTNDFDGSVKYSYDYALGGCAYNSKQLVAVAEDLSGAMFCYMRGDDQCQNGQPPSA